MGSPRYLGGSSLGFALVVTSSGSLLCILTVKGPRLWTQCVFNKRWWRKQTVLFWLSGGHVRGRQNLGGHGHCFCFFLTFWMPHVTLGRRYWILDCLKPNSTVGAGAADRARALRRRRLLLLLLLVNRCVMLTWCCAVKMCVRPTSSHATLTAWIALFSKGSTYRRLYFICTVHQKRLSLTHMAVITFHDFNGDRVGELLGRQLTDKACPLSWLQQQSTYC